MNNKEAMSYYLFNSPPLISMLKTVAKFYNSKPLLELVKNYSNNFEIFANNDNLKKKSSNEIIEKLTNIRESTKKSIVEMGL